MHETVISDIVVDNWGEIMSTSSYNPLNPFNELEDLSAPEKELIQTEVLPFHSFALLI